MSEPEFCTECAMEFDPDTDGSNETEGLCYDCEDYIDCPECGVELCKPSDCPDGSPFGCASCGGSFVRRGTKMVEDAPDAVEEANALAQAIRERDGLREALQQVLMCSDLRHNQDATAANSCGVRVMVDLYALVMARAALERIR